LAGLSVYLEGCVVLDGPFEGFEVDDLGFVNGIHDRICV
jgi:hypothetical protein